MLSYENLVKHKCQAIFWMLRVMFRWFVSSKRRFSLKSYFHPKNDLHNTTKWIWKKCNPRNYGIILTWFDLMNSYYLEWIFSKGIKRTLWNFELLRREKRFIFPVLTIIFPLYLWPLCFLSWKKFARLFSRRFSAAGGGVVREFRQSALKYWFQISFRSPFWLMYVLLCWAILREENIPRHTTIELSW
jgi:hypothetical protein